MSDEWEWDLILDRHLIERWFAEHFGDGAHFGWLVEDVVMREIADADARGLSITGDEFAAYLNERVRETLLALVEAEGGGTQIDA
jgi:hypothetical protein